jgi:hypothetical protein
MSTIREHEWAHRKSLYDKAYKKARKIAEESFMTDGKPVGMAFLRDPITGLGAGVALECEWPTEGPMLEAGAKQIEEGAE